MRLVPRPLIVLGTLLVCLASASCSATSYTWSGASSGVLNYAGNWSPSTAYPGAADSFTLTSSGSSPSSGTLTCTSGTQATGTLSGGTINVTTYRQSSGTMSSGVLACSSTAVASCVIEGYVTGSATLNAFPTISINGRMIGGTVNAPKTGLAYGVLVNGGGAITGTGSVYVNTSGSQACEVGSGGTISTGTFSCPITELTGGYITGGSFLWTGSHSIAGAISGGTWAGGLYGGSFSGGLFNGPVSDNNGTISISGGTITNVLSLTGNYSTITGLTLSGGSINDTNAGGLGENIGTIISVAGGGGNLVQTASNTLTAGWYYTNTSGGTAAGSWTVQSDGISSGTLGQCNATKWGVAFGPNSSLTGKWAGGFNSPAPKPRDSALPAKRRKGPRR